MSTVRTSPIREKIESGQRIVLCALCDRSATHRFAGEDLCEDHYNEKSAACDGGPNCGHKNMFVIDTRDDPRVCGETFIDAARRLRRERDHAQSELHEREGVVAESLRMQRIIEDSKARFRRFMDLCSPGPFDRDDGDSS